MDVVDGDDEDEEALRGLLRTQTGPSGAVEEAKVRSSQLRLQRLHFQRTRFIRASNAQNAARYSRTRRWRIIMQRRAVMISLRSLQRRFVLARRADSDVPYFSPRVTCPDKATYRGREAAEVGCSPRKDG